MLFVAIDSVQPGDRVARAIYDGRALPLVVPGTRLTEFEIRRLKSLGFRGVYVSIVAEGEQGQATIISESTRAAAVAHLSDTFSTLQEGGALGHPHSLVRSLFRVGQGSLVGFSIVPHQVVAIA